MSEVGEIVDDLTIEWGEGMEMITRREREIGKVRMCTYLLADRNHRINDKSIASVCKHLAGQYL